MDKILIVENEKLVSRPSGKEIAIFAIEDADTVTIKGRLASGEFVVIATHEKEKKKAK